MTDFLSQLDTVDAGDVPALCLVLADWLDERGEPSEGWRALGVRHRCPANYGELYGSELYVWFDVSERVLGAFDPANWLPYRWREAVNLVAWSFPSRVSALTAAAEAFVRLPEETRREILGQVETTLGE